MVLIKAFKNEAEVEAYQKESGKQIIIFEGSVYDVKEYMPTHPGGGDLIQNLIGKSIDEEFEDAGHTKSARNIFRDLNKIGHVETTTTQNGKAKVEVGLDGFQLESKIKLNYDRGLFYQVLQLDWSFDEYVQFINEPKHLVNPVSDVVLFDNPYLEFLTRTPWYAIPLGYGPAVLYFLYFTQCSFEMTCLFVFIGAIGWTLFEYLFHRFFFHAEDTWLPNYSVIFAYHFLIHGIHHAYPQDRMRLVFPPTLGYVILTLAVYVPCKAYMPAEYQNAFMAGFTLGYIAYDMVHYFIHHSTPADGYMKSMKIYHMQHHYKSGQQGFGVSSKFWDYVFQSQITNV